MYKLIAIDLDGTLLNSYGEISEENKNALLKAKSEGAKIVLTSGRTNTAMSNFAYEVGADQYIISGNGASVYDLKKNESMLTNYLPRKKIMEIIDICERNSMYYCVYTEEAIITKSLNYNTLFYYSENQNKPPKNWTNIILTPNVPEYIKKLKRGNFLKVTVCDRDKAIFQGMLTMLKKDTEIDVLGISHMSRKMIKSAKGKYTPLEYYYTEITDKGINKWMAIQFLIEKLKINEKEVIAIGDNTNDEEMIQNAGLGVAMGNSTPDLKQIADEVTNNNDENGVANIINKYF